MKNYTAKEVAKKLRIGEGAVYERVKNGKIAKVPNLGRTVRIPASELKKFKQNRGGTRARNFFTYDSDKIELIETHLGDVRKIRSNSYYILRDISSVIGSDDSNKITRVIENDIDNRKFTKVIPTEEALSLGLFSNQFGIAIISYEGILEYSLKNRRQIDWDKFLKELKPSNKNVQVELEELKTDNSNALSKIFEGTPVEIIVDENGEPLFELYTTGMALGQVVTAKGNIYPNKDRINKNIANADIQPVLRNAKPYLTEPMLYDFMFEAKTDKCKSFRKWVTNEVLPTIRKTGGYVNNAEKFTENYFSNLSEDTREIIKNELENKNKDLRLEKAKIEHELKSNTEMINLIDEA